MYKKKDYFLSVLICFVVISMLRTPGLGMQYMYGLHAINMIDSGYLANTAEMIGINSTISPRLIFDYLLYFPMKLGLSFEVVNYLYNIIADFVFSLAIVSLMSALKIKRLAILSVCFFLCIYTTPIISMPFGFPYHYSTVISITLAVAIEMIAISFALKKKYGMAFLFASIGGLFHIHECMYGGLLVLILAAIDCFKEHKLILRYLYYSIGWFVAILAFTIPTLITDRAVIPNDIFCDYYMNSIGHFGFTKGLFSNVCYYLSIVALYYITSRKLKSTDIIDKKTAIILFLIAILAMLFLMVFVDIYPIAFVYKLYVQKFFKYIALLFVLQFIVYVDNLIEERDYRSLVLLICWFPSIVITPILIILYASVLFLSRNKKEIITLPAIILSYTIFFGYSWISNADYMKMLVVLSVLPFLFPELKASRKLKYVTVLPFLIFLSMGCKRYYNAAIKENNTTSNNDEAFYMIMSEVMDKDETYILSPLEKDTYKAIHISAASKRSCYVWPMPPSTTTGTKINLERLSNLAGWEDWTLDQKCERAQTVGVKYIVLTKNELDDNRVIICENNKYVLIKCI